MDTKKKIWFFKSLPELRDNNESDDKSYCIIEENNEVEKVDRTTTSRAKNTLLCVPDDAEKNELLHRSFSVGYRSASKENKKKTHNVVKIIQTSPNNEVKEIEVNFSLQQQYESEDGDSGLYSANEDTEKILVSTEESAAAIGNFHAEIKLKAKEMKNKRRDNISSKRYKMKSHHQKMVSRHGSLLSERTLYRNLKSKQFNYNSEFDRFRSFKHKLDEKKTLFEVCSEIKEEEMSTLTEQDETMMLSKQDNNTNMLGLQTTEHSTSNRSIMNSLESILHKKAHLNPNAAAATMIATAAAAATSVPADDETLQKLFDIVMPPLLVSSSFDLSNNEDVAELSLMMHQHLNEATANSKMDFNVLSRKQPADMEANEHIMRTCLGYLDYINKKHTRERQLQVIRNKISGVVLLTLVFLMIFGLGLIMSIYLVKSLTGIMKSEYTKISNSIAGGAGANQTSLISNLTFMNIINSTVKIERINDSIT